MTQTKSVIRAVAKYDKSNIKGLYIKLHKEKDADIIQKLDNVNSKQGYIKQLIREDMQMENWIPVTERLPEPSEYDKDLSEWVLITLYIGENDYMVGRALYCYSEKKWYAERFGCGNVIAWMPLPTPYKK